MTKKILQNNESVSAADKAQYDEIGLNTNAYGQAVVGYGPYVDNPGTLTGIITVAAAGTPEAGPNVSNLNGFMVCAHPDNTDTAWFMGVGQTKTAAFPLQAKSSPAMMFIPVPNLSWVYFDVDVNGEKICWAKI